MESGITDMMSSPSQEIAQANGRGASFNERLDAVVAARGSNVCVGLDPVFDLVRAQLGTALEQHLGRAPLFLGFVSTQPTDANPQQNVTVEQLAAEPDLANQAACEITIAVTRRFAAAFKPNAAFFEFTVNGGAELAEVIRTEPAGSTVPAPIALFDGKRGDIGNTSEAYARSIFDEAGFDAVTVNPLMGRDAVAPFLTRPDKGAFLLCLTSNPGAEDFLLKNDLYLRIAEQANGWNSNGNVGLVVGATRPELAARVREVAPDLPLLIPGVGAQGGSLEETLDAIGARTNRRFLINASRSIMFAKTSATAPAPTGAIADAAQQLRDAISTVLAERR